MLKIFLQNHPSVEARTVSHAASLMDDVKVVRLDLEELVNYADELPNGLPVGSVEFLREAMRVCDIQEPFINPYPIKDKKFLSRFVWKAGEITDDCFIKPQKIKAFTGFVNSNRMGITMGVTDEEVIAYKGNYFCSEIVNFVSEWRYYIRNNKIVGVARYDMNEEEGLHLFPDTNLVNEYINLLSLNHPYVLDFGVLDTGVTALVEYNDFWAIGYYIDRDYYSEYYSNNDMKGLDSREYVEMLHERWLCLVGDKNGFR